jgi:hypothetical protein
MQFIPSLPPVQEMSGEGVERENQETSPADEGQHSEDNR